MELHLLVRAAAEHLLQHLVTDGDARIEHILQHAGFDDVLPLEHQLAADIHLRCPIRRRAWRIVIEQAGNRCAPVIDKNFIRLDINERRQSDIDLLALLLARAP